MFCQCIFNSAGKIINSNGFVDDLSINAETIYELFDEIGIADKEYKIGEQHKITYKEKEFKCYTSALGEDFQFIGIDVTNLKDYKGYYESQSRISDLNMNRLLKSIDDLMAENVQLKENENKYKELIVKTSHQLRSSLTEVIGVAEVLNDLSPEEKLKYIEVLKNSSQEILQVVNKLNID